MPKSQMRLSTVALASIAFLLAPSASAAVQVLKRPAKVEYRTFDRDGPRPADMPELKWNELAVTVFAYQCGTLVNYTADRRKKSRDGATASLTVQDVKVTLTLKITVWLPNDAKDRLKAHEEGHRTIGERFYAQAEAAAREAGRRADGQRFAGSGPTSAAALEQALAAASGEVTAAYRAAIPARAERTNDLFDELTHHGQKRDVEPADAIETALKSEAREFAMKGDDSPAVGK